VVNSFIAAYLRIKHPVAEMYPKFLVAIEREFG
jgi:hypothetical protein